MKTIWIVDGSYLFLAGENGAVDYLKLKNKLEELNGEPLFEGFYLNSIPYPATDEINNFHNWLKSASPRGPKMRVQLYRLKDMHTRCNKCNNTITRSLQKGVDVGIATLILKLAFQNQYDRLILTAGDGDFEDAISYVKSELKKEVWIAGFDSTVSVDLQCYADKVIWLNDFWGEIQKTWNQDRTPAVEYADR